MYRAFACAVVLLGCGQVAEKRTDAGGSGSGSACEGTMDCMGVCNGSATVDCAGACGGSATKDRCNECDGDPTTDCKYPDHATAVCSSGSAFVPCPAAAPAGQDGNYLIHVPTYQSSAETVIDPVTGLEWQRVLTTPVTPDKATASAFCDNLTLANHTDWRLPTRLELVTLLDASVGHSFNQTAFTNVPQNSFTWSSTPVAGGTAVSWAISTNYGTLSGRADSGASTSMLTRCVRGPAFTGSVMAVGDGTVLDQRTNLIWQSDVGPTGVWSAALTYCEALTLAGKSDWRVPNNKELMSIVDDTITNPAISTVFAMRPASVFWSSSPLPNIATSSYAINFANGATNNIDTPHSTSAAVRCVRNN